jgi:hypothetical protein
MNCCLEPVAASEACPCGQHDHDEQGAGPAGGDRDSREPDEHSPEHSPKHSPKHRCVGARCTFVRTQTSLEQIGELVSAEWFYLLEAADMARGSELFRSRLEHLNRQPFTAGSVVRMHLVLRVLLI